MIRFSLILWIIAAPAFADGATEATLPIVDPDDIVAVCGGDPGAGEANFAVSCAHCHTLEAGEPHLAGPNLYALYGRVAGAAQDYEYSAAIVAAGEEGMVWQRETLQYFLPDPAGFVPGTTHPPMPELADEAYRTDLMTYVRLTTTPPPPALEDVVVPEEVLAMTGDVAYGEYLSGECAGCHVSSGVTASGVPQIHGLDREAFILALFQYRAGSRNNQTMESVAGRLSDEEIVALAEYFQGLD